MTMSDYYEILQIHPKADQEAIRAAYDRLRERYDPARLEGAADELIELARQRRHDIERAYAVLGDPARRTTYDSELAARPNGGATPAGARCPPAAADDTDDDLLDYRPLPPARRQERPRGFNAQPSLSSVKAARQSGRQTRSGPPLWAPPAIIVGVLTFGVVLMALLLTELGRVRMAPVQGAAGGPAALATPGSPAAPASEAEILNQFESQIAAARQVTRDVPDNPLSWINLGNALYDSVKVVQERSPDSPLYKERLPRWIEAGAAYTQALKLDPGNAAVRADLAISLCYYGAGAADQSYISQGLDEARLAQQKSPEDSRALLSMGICLANTNPPQTEEAIGYWRKVLDVAAPGSNVAFEAQRLIESYQTPQ